MKVPEFVKPSNKNDENENNESDENETTGFNLTITNKQLPEIDDYNIDEEVELKIATKIIQITKPELDEKEQKSTELSKVVLEVLEIEILNQKEERRNAKDMNLEMSDYKKIQSKRKGGGGIIS